MSDDCVNTIVNSSQNCEHRSSVASKPGNGMSKVLLIDECVDHDIPKALKTVMSSLDNPTITDLTVVLIYIMTVETGFTPSCCEPFPDDYFRHYDLRRLHALTEMPVGWKEKEGSYKLTFFLQPFPDKQCQLICNKILDRLSISMFFCDTCCVLETCSMIINPVEFIYHDHGTQMPTFKNLKQLSVTFKNQIALVVKSYVMRSVDLNDGLLALPMEVLLKVFDYLNEQEIITLSLCSKILNEICGHGDNIIWRRLKRRKLACDPDPTLPLHAVRSGHVTYLLSGRHPY